MNPDQKGHLHPITRMANDIGSIFQKLGFEIISGPELETEWYCFDALNVSKDHPARDMQDTFYLSQEWLLRTHTSNVQVHMMENATPPIRIIAPGRCFRNENISARSHVFFHQVEGFYIDQGVTFADLMATMEEFISKLFDTINNTFFHRFS